MDSEPQKPSRPKITILTPVFNEQESLPLYRQEVERVLFSQARYEFKVLFIDDGSTDESWRLIREMAREDPRFLGIRLSRNFGAHSALSAGFAHAKGDAVATLAADLQDPPEVVLRFLEKWEGGAEIVWGRRLSRKDAPWRAWAGSIFYRLTARYAMPKGSKFTTGSFLLADKKVVECYSQFQEHNRVTFALVAWTGFDQEVVEYHRPERKAGVSGWNFTRMMKAMYDTFLGFSIMPVKAITLLGVLIFILNIGFSIYIFMCWVLGDPLKGWSSVMLGISFFFGLLFLVLGVLGEYLNRIYVESVRRPIYFVSARTEDPAGEL